MSYYSFLSLVFEKRVTFLLPKIYKYRIHRTLEMTSDAPTNAGKRFSLLIDPNDIMRYGVTKHPAF